MWTAIFAASNSALFFLQGWAVSHTNAVRKSYLVMVKMLLVCDRRQGSLQTQG